MVIEVLGTEGSKCRTLFCNAYKALTDSGFKGIVIEVSGTRLMSAEHVLDQDVHGENMCEVEQGTICVGRLSASESASEKIKGLASVG
jgi:hypothetical protein